MYTTVSPGSLWCLQCQQHSRQLRPPPGNHTEHWLLDVRMVIVMLVMGGEGVLGATMESRKCNSHLQWSLAGQQRSGVGSSPPATRYINITALVINPVTECSSVRKIQLFRRSKQWLQILVGNPFFTKLIPVKTLISSLCLLNEIFNYPRQESLRLAPTYIISVFYGGWKLLNQKPRGELFEPRDQWWTFYLNTSSWFAITDLWRGEWPKWSRAERRELIRKEKSISQQKRDARYIVSDPQN